MDNMKKLIVVMFFTTLLIPFPALSQDDNDEYIIKTFKAFTPESPKMAWLVPPDIIITDEKFPIIYLYTDAREIQKAQLVKPFDKAEIAKIRKKYGVACEEYPGERAQTTYYLYKMSRKPDKPLGGYPDRVFYTSKATEPAKAGFKYGVLEEKKLRDVFQTIKTGGKKFLHRHFTVLPAGSAHVYSFHGFYDDKSKLIFKEAVVLHDANGRVLAKISWDISEDTLCDGCPHPAFLNENPEAPAADMTESFRIINAFSLPRFSYPVLMLETSSVETRAISFMTFDAKGKYSEYRASEYFVNCLPEN